MWTSFLLTVFTLMFVVLVKNTESKTSFTYVVKTKRLPQKISRITVGGIFPMSGSWAGGKGCYPAALRALEDVNMNSTVLPNHYLVLHSNDSKCEPGLGINALFDLIREKPTKLMVLGPGCSTVATFVAEAAKMWNLVVLSYGSSSPALSNRNRFPTFFRTHPSATLDNPARIKLIKEFNWTHISIVQQIEEVFTTTAEDLERLSRLNNVSIVTRQSFLTDPVDAVKNLKKHDARIIIGLFYENMARAVLCAAYKEKLTTPRQVWFLIGWYANGWYKEEPVFVGNSTNCTVDEMKAAAEGHFTVEPVFLDRYSKNVISGISVKQFEDYIQSEVSPTDPGYVEAPLAYDAVWTMALAIDKTINNLQRSGHSIDDFSYTDAMTMQMLKASLAQTSFQGLSSYVAFSKTGDRIAKIVIEQLQNDKYVTVGYYDSQKEELLTARKGPNSSSYGLVEYKFYQKSGLPPKDRKLIHFKFLYISLAIVIVVWLMTFVHGCCCVAYFVASNILSNHFTIRSSVPWLNTAILAGCIVANIGVCVYGLANNSVTKGFGITVFIHIGAFLQSIGFTLSVGGMFLKTLLLRRLMPRLNLPKNPANAPDKVPSIANVPLQNTDLLWYERLVVSLFLVFDLIFHAVWVLVDPTKSQIKDLESEERRSDEDDDIFIRPRVFNYDCKYLTIWLGVCLCQKGFLLLAATFFSFDTRNLKHRLVADSKFINLSIYNIAVFALITVPLMLLIKDKPTASFSFMAGAVLLCTWITLGLICVPKLFTIARLNKTEKSEDRIGQSDGALLSADKKGGAFKRKMSSRGSGLGVLSESTEHRDEVEDEEKVKKLMGENEQLKKQIAEKEGRLAELKAKLLSRLQNELVRPNPSNDELAVGDYDNEDSGKGETSIRTRAATVHEGGGLRLPSGSCTNGDEQDSLLTTTNNNLPSNGATGVPTTGTELSETYI